MTIRYAAIDFGTIKAMADVPAARACLRCGSTFWSEGFGERICSRCKGSAVWRSAIHEGSRQGRRRSVGRSPKV
jgi:DnaJ-class molecular chaperone